MKFQSITDANQALVKYALVTAQLTGTDLSPSRMLPILALVDNPHQKLKIVHIAGTSGKTSTAYYCSELLSKSGKSVGLTVSPHITSVTERVQINNQPINDTEFCEYLEQLLSKFTELEFIPSYFEVMIALALWIFADKKLGYAVVETGLGGLFDSTNVLTDPSKVCVVTDIGLDHTNVLGETIEQIARHKAGIIHSGNQVFMIDQGKIVNDVFQVRSDEVKAHLNLINASKIDAGFRARNMLLAKATCKYIAQRDGFELASIEPDEVHIPGRTETLELKNGSVLILDGAHNQQKMKSLASYLRSNYPNKSIMALVAFKPSKDYKKALDEILPICQRFIVTIYNTSQDLIFESIEPQEIAEYLKKQSAEVVIEPNNKRAFEELVNAKSDIKLVTGSFYLVGQLHNDAIKSVLT